MGGSGSNGNPDHDLSDGSFGGYGDDFSEDTTDSTQNNEVEGGGGVFRSSGGENGLDGGATEKGHKDEPYVKQFHPVIAAQLSAACSAAENGGNADSHNRRSSFDDNPTKAIEGIKLTRLEQDETERDGKGHGNDSDGGKYDSAYSDNDYLTRLPFDDNDAEIPAARWPTRKSVRSSSGYIFYATKAGDFKDASVQHPDTPRAVGRRNEQQEWWLQRRRRFRQPKAGGVAKQADVEGSSGSNAGGRRTSSSTPVGGQGEICRDGRGGGSTEPAVTGEGNLWYGRNIKKKSQRRRRNNVSGGRRHLNEDFQAQPTIGNRCGRCATERNIVCNSSGGGFDGSRAKYGVDCYSAGLLTLENDVKEAMIAVWLAWGVRIDAAREKLRMEEKRLRAVHRADTAKVVVEFGGGGGQSSR